ncbi:MAG: helix-turn-helix domain-containing protein [Rhodospirillales bacterium]|nr:helix-turn-helix domain-containing protein [Rhodospirillales bacterium]
MWVQPEQHKTVGKVLAEFRKQAGLRQQDLAALLGKPQSFVSSYEAGQRRIDVLELLLIAKALECSAEDIFSRIVRAVARQRSRGNA